MPKGTKFDTGKLDWSHLPVDVIEPLVAVFSFGAEKYGRENWRKGFENSDNRLHASRMRHIVDCQYDPLAINEDDGGVYHEAQVAWNSLVRLHHALERQKQEVADRLLDEAIETTNFVESLIYDEAT
jgi:hypothetical protein